MPRIHRCPNPFSLTTSLPSPILRLPCHPPNKPFPSRKALGALELKRRPGPTIPKADWGLTADKETRRGKKGTTPPPPIQALPAPAPRYLPPHPAGARRWLERRRSAKRQQVPVLCQREKPDWLITPQKGRGWNAYTERGSLDTRRKTRKAQGGSACE